MSAIFLLGFMGSGKSAVARHLARLLKLPLIDLDQRIETQVGTSVADFFASQGEYAFRELESATLYQLAGENGVISLGGGVPTREINRNLLKKAALAGSLVVYLKADSDTLATRIRRQPGKRPLIDGSGQLDMAGTRKRVEELLEIRGPWYLQAANMVVDTNARSIDEVAQEIADRWQFGEPDASPQVE